MQAFKLSLKLSLFLFLSVIYVSVRAENLISVDFEGAYLSDVILSLANILHVNVMLSSSIMDTVTLHFKQVSAEVAFTSVLTTYNLQKWPIGNVLFIAPRDELIKKKQEEVRWQELWENTIPIETMLYTIKYANAQEIFSLFSNKQNSFLSRRATISVDKRTNSLCIQDIPKNLLLIRHLINQLDVPIKQLLIKARLVSVDQDDERELGLTFSIGSQEESSKQNNFYQVAVAKLSNHTLDMKLAALEKNGHAELISTPSLFTSNQQAASIEAGEEVPYQEFSEKGGTSIAFKKAVLGLKVIPQILPNDKVLLQLEINQDRPSNRIVSGMPSISTRQIRTQVLLSNKQTMVLGGIYETIDEHNQQRLPFISQMPIIGKLLSQHASLKTKRELLIFITPTIIS